MYLQFAGSSLNDLGLVGVKTSPGVGEQPSSSLGPGETAEVGVIDPTSSSPSNFSPSSGDPSSPPSPETKYKYSLKLFDIHITFTNIILMSPIKIKDRLKKLPLYCRRPSKRLLGTPVSYNSSSRHSNR